MPYFKTSQEWLEQSALLLEARPTTTRITTRYSIKPAPTTTRKAAKKTTSSDGDTTATDAARNATPAAAKQPRAVLVIKTYDPASGVTLKYRTTKAAEVSRLIQTSLGTMGRSMAALPPVVVDKDVAMPDAAVAPEGAAAQGLGQGQGQQQKQEQQQQQQGGGGGGKKKKKGKR